MNNLKIKIYLMHFRIWYYQTNLDILKIIIRTNLVHKKWLTKYSQKIIRKAYIIHNESIELHKDINKEIRNLNIDKILNR